MAKKKFIIVLSIIYVIVLVFQCGAQVVYNNYRFGQEFYSECSNAAVLCDGLARWTDYLMKEFNKDNVDPADVITWSFESALDNAVYFGYEDMPLLDEVRTGYSGLFERIRRRISLAQGETDPNMERYQRLFVDPEGAQKMAALKEQLDFMKAGFMEIHERYNEMSKWEKCFTSWSKERKVLSEKLKMPETLAAWSNELK